MKTSLALSLMVVALCCVKVHGQDNSLLPNYQLSGTFLLEPAQTVAFPMYAFPQNASELYPYQPLAYDPSIFQQPAFFIPQAPAVGYAPQGFGPMNQYPVAAAPQAWPRAIVPTPNVNYPQFVQAGVPGPVGQQPVYYFQPNAAAPEANKVYPVATPKAMPLSPCQLMLQKMMAQSQTELPSSG